MAPLMDISHRKKGDRGGMGGGMGSDKEDSGEFSIKLDPNKHASWGTGVWMWVKRIFCNY